MRISKLLLSTFLLTFLFIELFAQQGKNLAKVNSVNNEIVNAYTALTSDAAANATVINVASSTLNTGTTVAIAALAPGDLIMIIQMQGASVNGTLLGIAGSPNDTSWGKVTAYNNCGLYEFAQVKSVPNGTSIELDCGLTNNYTASGKTQVVRVPRYSTLTVNNSIIAGAWNGSTGGVVAIEVQGNTSIASGGKIYADATGFRGGSTTGDNNSYYGGGFYSAPDNGEGAEKGESVFGYQAAYDAIGGRYSNNACANGGGGGRCHNGGGGGGSNAGSILWNGDGNPDNSLGSYTTAWNLEAASFSSNTSSGGGRGGYSFSSAVKDPTTTAPGNTTWGGDNRKNVGGKGGRPLDYSGGRLFMGGGGGAGDQDNNRATSGANGGGIVYLMSYGTVTGSGTAVITSNGGTAANTPNPVFTSGGIDGAGGGGGGGAIVINSVGAISGIALNANGGNGGNQVVNTGTNEAEGPGGGGGGGYITVSNGTPTRTANGGNNGTTNSPALNQAGKKFEPNGATKGGTGINNASIANFYITANNVTVCSGSTATLTATLNGTPPSGITVNWFATQTGGSPLASGTSYTTPALTSSTTYYVGTCPGTYRIPVIVTVGAASTASAGNDQTICSGSSANLSAVNATACAWTADPTLSATNNCTPVATPTATTSYYVTLTDGSGCTKQDTVVVNVVNFNINITSDTTICPGASALLTASGGSSYTWTSSPAGSYPATSSITVTPSATTTYTVASSNGTCTKTKNVTVTVRPDFTVGINPVNPSICSGDSVQLSSSNSLGAAASYSWSPSATLSAASGSAVYASPANTTTYTVNANINGCVRSGNITVVVNTLPAVSFTPPNPGVCAGSSVNVTANGGNSCLWGSDPTLSNGANCTATMTPSSATYYTVTVTDNNGCKNTDSVQVTVNAPFALNVSNDTTICPGVTTTVSASGASTYSWSSNPAGFSSTNPSENVTPAVTTTYYLTASNGICSQTDSVKITVNPDFTVSVNPSAPVICAGDTIQLIANNSLNTNATYSWSPASSITSTTNDSVGVFPSTTSTYTVNTSINGCVRSSNVVVNVNQLPVVSFNPSGATVCSGSSLSITASGGTSCSWQPVSTLTNAGNCTASVSPVIDTYYTVTVTDNNSCSNTDSVLINVGAPMSVTTSNDTSICPGSSATISASGAGTYSWSSLPAGFASSTASNTVNPSVNTTYYVTASNGVCSVTDSVVITVKPDYTLSINPGSPSICTGDSVLLTVSNSLSSGATYSWSPASGLSATTGSSVYASPSGASIFTVTSDINGCIKNTNVTVNVNNLPVISFTPANPVVCAGSSIGLAASGGNSCSWQADPTLTNANSCTPTVAPNSNTYYTVTVTDANNCSNTDSVLVSVGNGLSFQASNDTTICSGSSAVLYIAVPAGGATYSWSPSATLSGNSGTWVVATPTAASTTYYVTADNGTCQGTDSVTVNWQPAFTASVTPSAPSICVGDNVSLTASNSLASSANYTWSPSSGLSSTSGATVSANPSSTTTYQVTADVNGCTETASVVVSVNALPVVLVTPNASTICSGDNVNLTASGADTYTWSPSGSLSASGGTSVTASPTSTTTYTITGTQNGCSNSTTVTVSVVPSLVISATASDYNICVGETTALNATAGAASYSWVSVPVGTSGNTASLSVNPASTTTYTVTATSGTCTDTGIVTIVVNSLPVVTVNNPTICAGQSATLNASGAFNYSWTASPDLNTTTGPTVIATPVNTGTYIVTGTDNNNCSSTASSVVTVVAQPTVTYTVSDNSICENGCVSFVNTSTNATSWIWNFGDGNTSTDQNGSHCYATAGTYQVSLQAANGTCIASSATNEIISVAPSAQAAFASNPNDSIVIVNTSISFTNQSSGAIGYNWNFGDNDTSAIESPTHNYAQTGTYQVTLIAMSANGCNDTISKTLRVESPKNIPNIFSPNGDGSNDQFFLQSFQVNKMEIFNRWGELVFKTPANVWDGHSQSGSDVPAGVYYYVAELSDSSKLTGYITLVK